MENPDCQQTKMPLYVTSWLISKYYRHMRNVQSPTTENLNILEFNLSGSLGVKYDGAIGLPYNIWFPLDF